MAAARPIRRGAPGNRTGPASNRFRIGPATGRDRAPNGSSRG